MVTYKVWLTVKDSYGNIKEIDGGNIEIGLGALSVSEIEALDKHFATDVEVTQTVEQSNETIRYSGFEFNDEEGAE